MINPINILEQTLNKASQMAVLACRSAIHASRANKLSKIDLRKYRGNPEKKKRITMLIFRNGLSARIFLSQMFFVSSQPIRTKSFSEGGEIVGEIND